MIKIEEYFLSHECMQSPCLCSLRTLSTQDTFLLFKVNNLNFHKQDVTVSIPIFISYFTFCFFKEKQLFPHALQVLHFYPGFELRKFFLAYVVLLFTIR